MLRQIEGSRAVAEGVALCRPEVISAFPISPQTHIVEALSAMVKSGALAPCEYLNVESEFAAMSAAIGAPINIWNDHSDSMSQRDSGWLQLYAETNQEALDLHIQAFRIAEELSVPVMVCMDGFVLTHAFERVDVPGQNEVDEFLPPFEPRQLLDPAAPLSIGAMVGPEAFTEVRYRAHVRQLDALAAIPAAAAEFADRFGRTSGGLVRPYRTDDAETVVIALGSVLGTLKDTVDTLREDGVSVGVVGITTFRPFPHDALRTAVGDAARVIVLERAFSLGTGGVVTADARAVLGGRRVHTVVAGLGGRPVTEASLRGLLLREDLDQLTFLDLNHDLVES
jgi:pyruvate ferredoxin oxidoreductase alpha subunit